MKEFYENKVEFYENKVEAARRRLQFVQAGVKEFLSSVRTINTHNLNIFTDILKDAEDSVEFYKGALEEFYKNENV